MWTDSPLFYWLILAPSQGTLGSSSVFKVDKCWKNKITDIQLFWVWVWLAKWLSFLLLITLTRHSVFSGHCLYWLPRSHQMRCWGPGEPHSPVTVPILTPNLPVPPPLLPSSSQPASHQLLGLFALTVVWITTVLQKRKWFFESPFQQSITPTAPSAWPLPQSWSQSLELVEKCAFSPMNFKQVNFVCNRETWLTAFWEEKSKREQRNTSLKDKAGLIST